MKFVFVSVFLFSQAMAAPANKSPKIKCELIPHTDEYAILDKLCFDCAVMFGPQTHAECRYV